MVAEIARRLEAGLEPAAVAARVLEAIRGDELYVFTHPDMRGRRWTSGSRPSGRRWTRSAG